MRSPTEEGSIRYLRGPLLAGTILGALGIALGAFGAHVLDTWLGPDALSTYETAVRYHLVHAVALVATSPVLAELRGSWASWSWRLLTLGVVLFSGSLYVVAVTGAGVVAVVAPFGGLALLAGWTLLGLAAFRGS